MTNNPKTMFNNIIGQDQIKIALTGAIKRNEVGHAYLFAGPGGSGKRTIAETFARAILCTGEEEKPCGVCKSCLLTQKHHHPDLMHVVPDKGNIKIETVREMMRYFADVPRLEHNRVIIIENSSRMTVQAQNALLKSLEEPEPGHVFILTAESAGALLPTIASRCQCFKLTPLNDTQMTAFLKEKGCPSDRVPAVIEESEGLPGHACQMMEEDTHDPLRDLAVSVIDDIQKGKRSSLFDFAEKAASEDDRGIGIMKHLLRFFDGQLSENLIGVQADLALHPQAIIDASQCLLELSVRLNANTNARLQWEGALLGIAKCFERYQ